MTKEQEIMLRELHEAVIGNDKTDTTGLIKRVKSLEAYRASDKTLKAKLIGGFIVLGFVWEFIKHKILGL